MSKQNKYIMLLELLRDVIDYNINNLTEDNKDSNIIPILASLKLTDLEDAGIDVSDVFSEMANAVLDGKKIQKEIPLPIAFGNFNTSMEMLRTLLYTQLSLVIEGGKYDIDAFVSAFAFLNHIWENIIMSYPEGSDEQMKAMSAPLILYKKIQEQDDEIDVCEGCSSCHSCGDNPMDWEDPDDGEYMN